MLGRRRRQNRRGIGGGLGQFLPTQLSGCVLWLRADLGITKDGSDKVSQWDDQSGNGHHVAQGTGAKQPLWLASSGVNATPCVEFDGVDDFLRATWAQSQPVTLFAQLKFLAVTDDTAIDGSAGGAMRLTGFNSTLTIGAAGASVVHTTTPLDWHSYEVQYNGASGSVSTDNGTPTTGNIGSTSPGGIILGLYGDQVNFPANCQIGEVIMYDRIPVAGETTRIHAYLQGRY